MKLTGTIKTVEAVNQVNDKFKYRLFVLVDDSNKYTQHVLFQLSQQKTDLIMDFMPGDKVHVYFNVLGKEYTNKEGKLRYINTLDVWKIENAN